MSGVRHLREHSCSAVTALAGYQRGRTISTRQPDCVVQHIMQSAFPNFSSKIASSFLHFHRFVRRCRIICCIDWLRSRFECLFLFDK
jgi:hypothetical protein